MRIILQNSVCKSKRIDVSLKKVLVAVLYDHPWVGARDLPISIKDFINCVPQTCSSICGKINICNHVF